MNWEVLSVALALVGSQAVNIVVVRAIVRAEVAKLNGTYLRTGIWLVRDGEIERRLHRLEA